MNWRSESSPPGFWGLTGHLLRASEVRASLSAGCGERPPFRTQIGAGSSSEAWLGLGVSGLRPGTRHQGRTGRGGTRDPLLSLVPRRGPGKRIQTLQEDEQSFSQLWASNLGKREETKSGCDSKDYHFFPPSPLQILTVLVGLAGSHEQQEAF